MKVIFSVTIGSLMVIVGSVLNVAVVHDPWIAGASHTATVVNIVCLLGLSFLYAREKNYKNTAFCLLLTGILLAMDIYMNIVL